MKKHYSLFLVLMIVCAVANAQFSKLLDFAGTSNGSTPYGNDLYSDGTFLYGMTYSGGANNDGVIFKIMPNGSGYVKLLDFAGTTNGANPEGTLISDGTFLYGTTYAGGSNSYGVIFKIKPDGTGYVKLLDFTGPNGNEPFGSLITDGTYLYGMTGVGGANSKGLIYKIKPDGTGYADLFDFAGTNGWSPEGSLFSDGTYFYGTTVQGGTSGDGNVFKVKMDGTGEINLINFSGANGNGPDHSSLISDGTYLYGMTFGGGVSGNGIIFKVKPDGTGFTDLCDFTNALTGTNPRGSLVSDGTFLYGFTYNGGANGGGVIFRMMPDGTNYTDIYDLTTAGGKNPQGSLILSNGCLYGMTQTGGANGDGTVISYCVSAGINENKSEIDFSIYPNPTNGQFQMQINSQLLLANSQIEIYNTLGEKVYQETLTDKGVAGSYSANGTSLISINVGTLRNGIYLLQLKTKTGEAVKKIMVQK
jgi:uncharacterized repeat protein (TIGR03803 family)